MDERQSRVACIAHQQQALIRALLDDVIAEWLELDLTMAQLKALFALDRQPGATVSALADQLGITSGRQPAGRQAGARTACGSRVACWRRPSGGSAIDRFGGNPGNPS